MQSKSACVENSTLCKHMIIMVHFIFDQFLKFKSLENFAIMVVG